VPGMLPSLLIIAVVLAFWEVVTRLELYPDFIVPPPAAVWDKFLVVAGDGRLWLHLSTTLTEIVLGLLIGIPFGLSLGYALAKSRLLEAFVSPLVLAAQSTPVVAYAPILVIWFGTGLESKVFICALIVFFPMLLNTLVAVRGVPEPERDVLRTYSASRWQTLTRLEIPASLPILFGGLRISATLAVIGAVVGEFISANAGLGFWIKLARDQYDTALVAVAVITLAVLARVLYGLVSVAERLLVRGRRT